MGFKTVQSLDAEVTTALGGKNKQTGKLNPTTVEGYYLGTRQVDSKKARSGKADIHILQTDKGNLGVWGKTDLDRKIRSVTPGVMVRITVLPDRQPTPNGDMYKFKVELDEDNKISVGDLNEAFAESAGQADSYSADADAKAEPAYEEPVDEVEETPAPSKAKLTADAAARAAKVQALLNGSKPAAR